MSSLAAGFDGPASGRFYAGLSHAGTPKMTYGCWGTQANRVGG
jgi:hypothetical protein